MYAAVPSSSWITCPSSSFSPGRWKQRNGPGAGLPALVDAYGVSEFMPVTQAWVTFTMFSHSPLPKPQSEGTKGKDILPRGNLQVSPWATDPGVISSSAPARPAKVRASNLAQSCWGGAVQRRKSVLRPGTIPSAKNSDADQTNAKKHITSFSL